MTVESQTPSASVPPDATSTGVRRSIVESVARRNFWVLAVAIGILALLLREYFILVTQIQAPIHGDIVQYVSYAWNLVHRHTFSDALPGSAVVTPDAFRGPGYPLFLATTMLTGDHWYALALQAQAILGTATVTMGILLARHWLSRRWSLAAGVLMAVWPHHIAATDALLSELVFGFALMLSLLLTAMAQRRGSPRWGAMAGIAYGYAYLINPIILFFPFIAATLFWRQGLRRVAIWMLALSLAIAGGWALRNATLPAGPHEPGRAEINFVQGSWPLYQAAYLSRNADPVPRRIMQEIDGEIALLNSHPREGLVAIMRRMHKDPWWYYAQWYLLEKPWLLWDWDIRLGYGDVYFHAPLHSPLETHPLLRGIKTTLHALNPAIFLLSLLATAGIIVSRLRRLTSVGFAPLLVALFFVYVTLVHTVFQAEPRYSIPYRPMQLLLAVTALAAATGWLYAQRRNPEPDHV